MIRLILEFEKSRQSLLFFFTKLAVLGDVLCFAYPQTTESTIAGATDPPVDSDRLFPFSPLFPISASTADNAYTPRSL